MKRNRTIILFLLILFILGLSAVGCADRQTVDLYIIPADRITDGASLSDIKTVAEKKGRIAFTLEDFSGVDWENQRFAIRPEASPSISTVTRESGGSALLKSTGDDRFLWVVNGKAVYLGGFTVGIGSTTPKLSPTLVDTERYIFEIRTDETQSDVRFNKTLYHAFYSASLIKSEL